MELVVFVIIIFAIVSIYRLLGKVADNSGIKQKESLKIQIQAELFPRPTCSILKRHYDALVIAELERRLV